MSRPRWLDELAQRYLADEGNIFLLHGEVDGLEDTLVPFLSRTREVVSVLQAGEKLSFPNLEDRGRFERLVGAQELFSGHTPLDETEPTHALARVWQALGTPDTAQGYIVSDAGRFAPPVRRPDPLPSSTPVLSRWSKDPRLVDSNHIIIFLTRKVDLVHAEVAATWVRIEVSRPVAPPSEPVETDFDPPPVHDTAIGADRAPATPSAPEPPTMPAFEGELPPPQTLAARLAPLLAEAIHRHPEEHRPPKVPVMDAVAQLIAEIAPDRCGALTFTVDEDGHVSAEGDGADWFLAAWRKDIALDAASGMLLKELGAHFDATTLSETAVAALSRRIARIVG